MAEDMDAMSVNEGDKQIGNAQAAAGQKAPRISPGNLHFLVEAAGQLFHLFRDGLDYAFIRRSHDRVPERGVLSESSADSGS